MIEEATTGSGGLEKRVFINPKELGTIRAAAIRILSALNKDVPDDQVTIGQVMLRIGEEIATAKSKMKAEAARGGSENDANFYKNRAMMFEQLRAQLIGRDKNAKFVDFVDELRLVL